VAGGTAWVDGRILPIAQASVPVSDRGFLLGDSVFDTLRTRGGRPFLIGDHLDRLRRSAAAARIPVPWTDAELTDIAAALLPERPEATESVLRFTLTRGDGGHGLLPPATVRPRLVVLCRPMPDLPARLIEDGVGVALDPRPLGRDPSLPAGIKSGNYLGSVIAVEQARAQGVADVLVRGPEGGWIEATSSNLFVLSAGALLAPGERQGALPGITRALTLELWRRQGLPVDERSVQDDDLDRAEEVFITSTVKGILPVVRVDGRPVAAARPGARTRSLITSFDDAVRRIRRLRADRLCQAFEP
jgi:branched-chain amino acid aminotransferase